jgi:3,4-dihydroxy-2-butanone 4-phosphate synthase
MAGLPELEALAARHGLKLGHVDDLVRLRREAEPAPHAAR